MMPFLRIITWLLFFATATFGWIVIFEHGFQDFAEGWRNEWKSFGEFLRKG